MKTRQKLLTKSGSIWGWEVTRIVYIMRKSWRPARTSTGRSCFHSKFFESSKHFPLPGRRLDSNITTCCSLELWPQALGTDTYLIHRREACAYQHQPTSTSLFPQNGCFHPSDYLRSFELKCGHTGLFSQAYITLHFQDILYNHALEFVIGKCRIKLHKMNFFLVLTLIFFHSVTLDCLFVAFYYSCPNDRRRGNSY